MDDREKGTSRRAKKRRTVDRKIIAQRHTLTSPVQRRPNTPNALQNFFVEWDFLTLRNEFFIDDAVSVEGGNQHLQELWGGWWMSFYRLSLGFPIELVAPHLILCYDALQKDESWSQTIMKSPEACIHLVFCSSVTCSAQNGNRSFIYSNFANNGVNPVLANAYFLRYWSFNRRVSRLFLTNKCCTYYHACCRATRMWLTFSRCLSFAEAFEPFVSILLDYGVHLIHFHQHFMCFRRSLKVDFHSLSAKGLHWWSRAQQDRSRFFTKHVTASHIRTLLSSPTVLEIILKGNKDSFVYLLFSFFSNTIHRIF